MELNISNQTDFPADEALLRNWAKTVCDGESASEQFEINLIICGDEEISRMNKRYRGDDRVTDVLSFGGISAKTSVTEPFQPVDCGIVIDIKQLDRQKGQNSIHKELMDIFIHGLLHALGYDHIRAEDARLMENKEKHYLLMLEGTVSHG